MTLELKSVYMHLLFLLEFLALAYMYFVFLQNVLFDSLYIRLPILRCFLPLSFSIDCVLCNRTSFLALFVLSLCPFDISADVGAFVIVYYSGFV